MSPLFTVNKKKLWRMRPAATLWKNSDNLACNTVAIPTVQHQNECGNGSSFTKHELQGSCENTKPCKSGQDWFCLILVLCDTDIACAFL